MKKIFTLLAFAACCAAAAWSCSDEYDDSGLRQEIADIRQEIASMKEQVNSLKTLVDALNGNKFITNYTESDDGWSITFNDGKTITIRDGEKGADAPVLGIARFEGVYYWTLGGADEWLLDDAGSKIPVAGQDGKTPSVDEEGYWTIDGEPVKCTEASEYITKMKRIAAVNLKEGDGLVHVEYMRETTAESSILLVTEGGMSIRFASDTVPVTGRASAGVKCIKLDDGDGVIFAGHVPEEGELLVATDRGYMKRSFIFDHEIQGRNGKGLQCFGFKKNGSNGTRIAAVMHVTDPLDLAAVQKDGTQTVFNTEEVRIEPRAGRGQPMVMVLMDNTVAKLKKTDSSAKNNAEKNPI